MAVSSVFFGPAKGTRYLAAACVMVIINRIVVPQCAVYAASIGVRCTEGVEQYATAIEVLALGFFDGDYHGRASFQG
jgi:hypothetical protein